MTNVCCSYLVCHSTYKTLNLKNVQITNLHLIVTSPIDLVIGRLLEWFNVKRHQSNLTNIVGGKDGTKQVEVCQCTSWPALPAIMCTNRPEN